MIRVYKGEGPTDAHLVSHWLERNGISTHVRTDLSTTAGPVPMQPAWPSVWVRTEDQERAEKALVEFRQPHLVHPPWECPKCGEENPPAFGACWNCNASG
jgi:hypothetical protein